MANYLIISPVRDEERYIQRTLESVVSQSIKPERWVIVDDGSTDRTPYILAPYVERHPFIRVVRRSGAHRRGPGSAVVQAFDFGYESVRTLDHDFVVKLDCDLSFEGDYFERLLAHFKADPKLGTASGVYMESHEGGDWRDVAMPSYHAAGASKMLRRKCFEQIGGFVPARGWDTVDEIRAMAHGWRTTHFSELKMKHWKPEGTGIGPLRTNFMHGEVYYRTGGSRMFFVLKVLHRMACRPLIIAGLSLLWGYGRTMLARRELLVTPEEARWYRAMLWGRIIRSVSGFAPILSAENPQTSSFHVRNLRNL